MDTLNTPDGGQHPSSIGERQPSQLSTTPLLNSVPSVEHQTSSEYLYGDHNKINNNNGFGDRSVEVVVDLSGGTSLQNGAHTKTDFEIERDAEDEFRWRGTTIPIREEFRCQRFWFFYHDLRALTTSVS